MKIIAIADTHGHLPDIPECDLLLVAGDVCPDYINTRIGEGWEKQVSWLLGPFSDWLDRIPAQQVVGIAGNHDFAFEKDPEIGDALPWKYLCDEWWVWNGLVIYGIPWVPNLERWAFYANKNVLYAKYNRIPMTTDIVLSHGPPYRYGDLVNRPRRNEDPNVGSSEVNRMLNNVKPKLLVCGHIHEAYGLYRYRDHTDVVNAAYLDDSYQPVHAPVDVSFVTEQ